MGVREVVQWWEEWQLRILVLTSLFLQCFLCFAGILRKSCIPSWLRFLIWLAYRSSDAIAIYALTTLFNRQRMQDWVSMSTHERSTAGLQALWAPVLLIHLGGQDGITAYNIEDNELWRQHVLTAVCQNAWEAGVLLFAVGILKCVLKPWELKRVSINSLVNSSAGSEQNREVRSLDEYIRAAMENFREDHGGQQSGIDLEDEDKMWKPYDLFIDRAPPYSDRLSCLKAMVHTDKTHDLVRHGLSITFDRLYTKESLLCYDMILLPDSSYTTKLLDWISSARPPVTMIAGILVTNIPLRISIRHMEAQPDEYDYTHTDVMITLILICHAAVLDFILPIPIYSIQLFPQFRKRRSWPDEVSQYNLMGYLVRNKKHKKLRRLATMLVCKDSIDQLWCMKPSKSSREITKLVHAYIAKGWTEHHIKNMATYRAFNDNRGQWTLNQEGCGDNLDWSLERPFDESVLLWHLATDICFHLTATPPSDGAAQRCRVMSNYMVYLLFVNPEMLMIGARRFLFREAYRQLKEMLKLMPQPDDGAAPLRHDECEFARKIALNIQQAGEHEFRFIYDAWRLAQHLQNLRVEQEQEQDNAKMWRVIQGVWVEMLCFSAGRCRGYLHAKSLGNGGEYLSYVWLLMSYMGMETLAERMQRPKLKEEDARNNGGSFDATTTAALSSRIATGGSANGRTAAILVPASSGGHEDDTTEASTPVTEGGDADWTIAPSPVMTTDRGGDGRTASSPVIPSGDENV